VGAAGPEAAALLHAARRGSAQYGAAQLYKSALHIGAIAFFHPASAIDETTAAQAQADLSRRILRASVDRGLIEKADAKQMLGHQYSGFSVDAGVGASKQTT
jgi:hypothetical protein